MTKDEVRTHLKMVLEKELIGPKEGPSEEFLELPTNRYIVGVLFPKDTSIEPEQEDESNTEIGEGENADAPAFMSVVDRLCPSSMGLSFVVEASASNLDVSVDWATHHQVKKHEKFTRDTKTKKITVKLDQKETIHEIDDKPRVELTERVYFNEPQKGKKTVSLFLVNREASCEDKSELSQRCVFSPRLTVRSEIQGILARDELVEISEEDDLKSLKLLYHDRHEYAVGHACSVMWDAIKDARCGRIWTTFIPSYLQHPTIFREKEYWFPMSLMMRQDKRTETLAALTSLANGYDEWIRETFEKNNAELILSFSDVAKVHLNRCKESLQRIRDGIEMLANDSMVFEAFCFMNEAMFLQRSQHEVSENYKTTGTYLEYEALTKSIKIEEPVWRPFQIGFILQSLPGIVQPKRADRQAIDLLWIPTGGGKTEAYLGLSAFTIAQRRLQKKGRPAYEYEGVSVMMRYTLRLLTIQQFQRAASLVCACEIVRTRNKAKWGQTPILVGLFVGEGTTPNHIGEKNDYILYQKDEEGNEWKKDSASYAVEHWRRTKEKPPGNNPFILTHCPWCGHKLGQESFRIDWDTRFLETHCLRIGCPFSKDTEIPAITVDDNIYSRLPSLLIATVDKFAQLPFSPKLGALFGHVDGYCHQHGYYRSSLDEHPTHRSKEPPLSIQGGLSAPDLVIQDELHLINGPLGSMVGMYETTIDYLSTRSNNGAAIRPKYIASTATIRRAADQVWNLFRRELKRFPSPGVDFKDSFFVRETVDEQRAKMFLGVFPSAIGQKTTMIRALSSMLTELAAMKRSGRIDAKDWDEYWTIVSYFNSIRELGSAKTTMEDDVQSRIDMAVRDLKIEELTSRVDSRDLPDILTKLSEPGSNKDAIDVLACSNMFSVGVDVQRLGLMVMNNQPKSVSEYIQATGRVGRRGTGLVLVLFNWARPRDQSHFERFCDFHSRIQIHVEAMTVTPFSGGVRQRALHAQYVALARILLGPSLSRNLDASRFDTQIRSSLPAQDFENWLESCIDAVEPRGKPALKKELGNFLDTWIDAASMTGLAYKRYRRENFVLMRSDPAEKGGSGPRVLTPNSMRNVEEEVNLHFVYGLGF